MKPFMKHRCG